MSRPASRLQMFWLRSFYCHLSLFFFFTTGVPATEPAYERALREHSFLQRAVLPAKESAPLYLTPPLDPLPVRRGLSAEHYPASNENRLDLFLPHIEGLGGGYVGVGTDQNLLLAGRARSEFAYLMDFDPAVVGINRIHLFFLRNSDTAEEFVMHWSRGQEKASWLWVASHFQNKPDFDQIQLGWKVAQAPWKPVEHRLREVQRLSQKYGWKFFLNEPADFAHLKLLVQSGRLQAVPGDLNGKITLKAIGNAAQKFQRPIRLLYLSNAEDYFKDYSQEFRLGVYALPVDGKSLVLRTCSLQNRGYSHPAGEWNRKKPFHYNIEYMVPFQARLKHAGSFRVTDILAMRREMASGLSIVGGPGGGRP